MKILILESSTTSAKAMVYDTDFGIDRVITRPFMIKGADSSVQDAESIWRQTTAVGKEVAAETDIDIIALVGTYHSVMLCEKDMTPKTPVYQWPFRGAGSICKSLQENRPYVRDYYKSTGCMVNAIYPSFKLMWMKTQGLDISKAFIMDQGSYNNYRATGKRWITDSVMSGTGLMDIHKNRLCDGILKEIGVSENQFCEIVTYRELASLTAEAAELLGLKTGIPVIPTGPDGGLNQVGAGALSEGVMTFSVGTSGALRLSAEKPILSPNFSTWCYRSPGAWMSGAATSGCCNCVDWAKHSLFRDMEYSEIEKGLGDTSLNMPLFLPFLFGERCPGWDDERSGGFVGLNAKHDCYDLYDAVLEGTLFNLYQCYTELTQLNGKPSRIMLSGGIAHSPYWLQMCADIFGRKMGITDQQHSSMMGGAVEAFLHLGIIDNLCDYAVETKETIDPQVYKNKIYMERYAEYLAYYNQTKELRH